ncbi:MAG: c-type cytochrome [Polyangiaceae bacterium]|nr:c-type cytochrome [Polyangiaceae bacterium]
MLIPTGLALLIVAAAACGGSSRPAEGPTDTSTTSQTPTDAPPAGDTFEAQVARGQTLYGEHCASCHGKSGEGKPGPAVVGLDKGALPLEPPAGAKARTTQFKTVYDVGDFVMKSMPPGKGGSLSADEYLAILAFDLSANGIKLDAPLDVEKAKALEIPRTK